VTVTDAAKKGIETARRPKRGAEMLTALDISITINNRPAGVLSLWRIPSVVFPDVELAQKYVYFRCPCGLTTKRLKIC
jgi:hypothetical protein